MHRSLHELGIDRLSVVERIESVQEIWDSVADSIQQLAPTPEQVGELDRRLDEDDQQPGATTDWQDVKAAASRRWARG